MASSSCCIAGVLAVSSARPSSRRMRACIRRCRQLDEPGAHRRAVLRRSISVVHLRKSGATRRYSEETKEDVTDRRRSLTRRGEVPSVSRRAPPARAARACCGSSAASAASAARRQAAEVDRRQPGADARHRRGGAGQRGDAQADQHAGQQRVGGGLAADADRLAGRGARRGGQPRPAAARAGCHGSVRSARSADRRSAASVYCDRSLVPIDRKSTCSSSRSASSAADGHLDHHAGHQAAGAHPRRRSPPPRRRWRPSAPSPTASVPVRRAASADRVQLALEHAGVAPGDPQPAHARAPGSPRRAAVAKASGLSEPASRVRSTTLRPAKASKHLGVAGGLLLDRRLLGAAEEGQLGAEQADALGVRAAAAARAPGAVLHVGQHLHRRGRRGSRRARCSRPAPRPPSGRRHATSPRPRRRRGRR